MKKNALILLLLSSVLSINLYSQSKPSVSVRLFVGEKALEPGSKVTLAQLSQLMVKVVPDSSSTASLDATYSMRWKMYVRAGAELGHPLEGTKEALYPAIVAMAKPGDVVLVEINNLTRTDSGGNRKSVVLSTESRYLSVTVTK